MPDLAQDVDADDLEASIDTLAGDWADVATLLDVKLLAAQRFDRERQCLLLTTLQIILSERLKILQEVAWDLVQSLCYYLCQGDTIDAAEGLLKLLVLHGNGKEVLIKLVEAVTTVDFEDRQEAEIVNAQICLLEAQESILCVIETRRSLRFLTEYTTCLVEVLSHAARYCSPGLMELYRDLINTSLTDGALARLYRLSNAGVADISDTLMRSFVSYVEQFTAVINSEWRCQAYFEKHHPSLVVPKTQASRLAKAAPDRIEILCEQLYEHDCVGLLLSSMEAGAEEDDSASDESVEDKDVQPSTTGVINILARTMNDEDAILLSAQFETFLKGVIELGFGDPAHAAFTDSVITVLYICLPHLSADLVTSLIDSEHISNLLNPLAAISGEFRDPNIRLASFYLLRDILALCPASFRAMYFISTLEECPIEPFVVATVGMIKDDLLVRAIEEVPADKLIRCMVDRPDQGFRYQQQVINALIALVQYSYPRTITSLARKWLIEFKVDKELDNTSRALMGMQIARLEEVSHST